MTDESHESADTSLQRRAVELAIAGSAVIVWRAANDPFSMVKLSLLAVAALAIVGLELWRLLDRGMLAVPRSRVLVALGVFLAVAAVSVVTSDMTWRSLYGPYGRGTGFVGYLASAVVCAGLIGSVRPETAWRVVRAILIGGGLVAVYAVVQRLGADPFTWGGAFGDRAAASTLGNTNFVSGYAAIILPLAVGAAILWEGRLRWLAIGVGVLQVLAMLAAQSQQGPIAAAAGLGVLVVVLVLERGGARSRTFLGAVAAIAVVGSIAVGLGLGGVGPFKRLNDTGFAYRRFYWSAAIEMTQDHPLAGVGFDRWAAHYREVREPAALVSTVADTTDEPHSVPLNMFASGGIPLGLAYLALIATTGVVLVRGLRRTRGPTRLLLASIGGAWVAYQVQAAVSIDVPSFPVLHLALAGLVVVVGGGVRWSSIEVPFLVRSKIVKGKNGGVQTYPSLVGTPALVIAVVVSLLALWPLSRPLRADVAAERTDAGLRAGAPTALKGLQSAFRLSPDETEYISRLGAIFGQQQNAQLALRVYEKAMAKDRRSFADVFNAARAARSADLPDLSIEYYERAIRLEPNAQEVKAEYGRALVRIGQVDKGIDLIRGALATQPDRVEWLLTLSRSLLAVGGEDEIRTHLEHILEIEHTTSDAVDVATLYRSLNDLDRAEEIIESILAEHPGNADALLEGGLIDEAAGRPERALERLNELIENHPGSNPQAEAAIERLKAATGSAEPDEAAADDSEADATP